MGSLGTASLRPIIVMMENDIAAKNFILSIDRRLSETLYELY
jgi:hypothetical protein